MDKIYKKDREHFKITGDWNKQSKGLKVRFPILTDSDLKFETGKENELLARIKSRLGKKHLEVMIILKDQQNYGTIIKAMARKFKRRTFQVGSNLPVPIHYNSLF